ncbi:MAG: glycosyltransferase [Nitrospira sp.]|nr:glycosyltransferase [Nitrospira sp.]
MNSPLVSVLLPVYNAASYVRESIESILGQTFTSFELIVIDDGSTDESAQVIRSVRDPRMQVINQTNQGLSSALNRAVDVARGAYLARQDADDISLPQRFERQVDFLEAHPRYGIIGTWADIRSENGQVVKRHAHPTESCDLKFELLFDNPFVHSSMMVRKQVFERVGGYSTDRSIRAEDYELWSRVARVLEVANIPEVLHIYRDTPGSKSKEEVNPLLESVINISINNLEWLTKREKQDLVINDLAALMHGAYHRVQGPASLHDLESTLFEAADKMSASLRVPSDRLREKAQTHRQVLLYHHGFYQDMCRLGFRWRINRLVRRMKQFAAG